MIWYIYSMLFLLKSEVLKSQCGNHFWETSSIYGLKQQQHSLLQRDSESWPSLLWNLWSTGIRYWKHPLRLGPRKMQRQRDDVWEKKVQPVPVHHHCCLQERWYSQRPSTSVVATATDAAPAPSPRPRPPLPRLSTPSTTSVHSLASYLCTTVFLTPTSFLSHWSYLILLISLLASFQSLSPWLTQTPMTYYHIEVHLWVWHSRILKICSEPSFQVHGSFSHEMLPDTQ